MSLVVSSPPRVLRARQVIPTREFLPLESIEHLDFDGDGLRYLWVYRSGLTCQRPESQVFRVDLESLAFEVVALPEALQRRTFSFLRLFGSQLLLLGHGKPAGFGLEPGGRIVESLHLDFLPRGVLLGASGELWIGGDGPSGGVLQKWRLLRGELQAEEILSYPVLRQVSCLGPGPLLAGLNQEGRFAFAGPQSESLRPEEVHACSLPLMVGAWRGGEWLFLGEDGRFWIQGRSGVEALTLLGPQGEALGRIRTARVVGRTLLALEMAPSQRIFRFRPQ